MNPVALAHAYAPAETFAVEEIEPLQVHREYKDHVLRNDERTLRKRLSVRLLVQGLASIGVLDWWTKTRLFI